eukprot:CAMPEP_0116127876 /NCGR_PEP_ID=MMETSP0329-20121206/7065_1 /TAXON_ID=697910 /ORGANISM="Pseudo-nitzschia arenysensis, Strain B593" /LENGTH=616 /DNA_ID=CAMNT_0003621987 /DNA_START=317 /DNA_END=2167 /DNA_ORIENTATION=+
MTLSPKFESVSPMKACEGERKEIDSPLTTQTDPSSCDEQSLMTPPPMPSRLGRIVISSAISSTDGSGSYVITNGEDESRTSSHRRLNVRRSANRSMTEEETSDQSQALVHALHQLHRLATLDSTEYQQRLLENTLPALETEKPKSLHCPSLADSSSSTEISQLSQSIQTPLVQLSMSIHRLHAVVANITREVDGHTDEVQELQSQLAALRRRNKQVESAAKKVHKKNIRLKEQAQHDRKIAQKLKHKVHQYEAQLESQGFQLMASKVQNHEIQLQLSKNQQNNNNNEGPMRERIDSNMSEFLDIDEYSHDESESVQTTTETEGDAQSVVTDTAMPTIRLSADEGCIITPEKKYSEKEVQSNGTSPTFSVEEPTRDKSEDSPKRKIPSHVEEPKPTENAHTRDNSSSFSNRFAKFLGSRAIANYNLKIVTPCNIQFVEIPLNASGKETEVVEDHGIDQMSKATAFAVCGLKGFNEELNMKPSIGAQLTKINGKAIDERWTLQTLYSELGKYDDSKVRTKVVLTFRDERWDGEQSKILDAAIRAVETTGPSSDSSQKEKPDGASLFDSQKATSSSSSSVEQAKQTDEETDPIQRVRTASADGVGKAFHGIGNFLHSLQ